MHIIREVNRNNNIKNEGSVASSRSTGVANSGSALHLNLQTFDLNLRQTFYISIDSRILLMSLISQKLFNIKEK